MMWTYTVGLIIPVLTVLTKYKAQGDLHDSGGTPLFIIDKYGLQRSVVDFAEIRRMLSQMTCQIKVEVQCVSKKTGRIKQICKDGLNVSHSNCCFLFYDSRLNENVTLNCYKNCSPIRAPIDPLPCLPESLNGIVGDMAGSQLPLTVYCNMEEEGLVRLRQCDRWYRLHQICCKLQLMPHSQLIPLKPRIVCTKRCWK